MTFCLFASDVHGDADRYAKLFRAIETERPDAVFLGGDLLPGLLAQTFSKDPAHADFAREGLGGGFARLRESLGRDYPSVFIILGNDDGRLPESSIVELAGQGLWHYVHNRHVRLDGFTVYGYCYVPPTPFGLKDWERYDVSRYVDPGCVPPEEGWHSVPPPEDSRRYPTIQDDLERLAGESDLRRTVWLFHAPPYGTNLDRAALDGRMVDHAPVDVHVGSIAIERFIRRRRPWLTLHGHVHESARLTGSWKDAIGPTWMFNAAHDGRELALIRFDLERPESATRVLL